MYSNPDTRPLPPGWHQHYDTERQSWYYVQIDVLPPKVSHSHPANLNESSSQSTVTPNPTSGSTPNAPILPPLEQHASAAPRLSAAQQLYASAINKKNAVVGKQPTDVVTSFDIGSSPPTLSPRSSSMSASSSQFTFSQHNNPNPRDFYSGSVVAHYDGPNRNGRSDSGHLQSASPPLHKFHASRYPVPVNDAPDSVTTSSALALSQMNRDNHQIIVTQATIPGDSPTIVMTPCPPKQSKKANPQGSSSDSISTSTSTSVSGPLATFKSSEQHPSSSGTANHIPRSSSIPVNHNFGGYRAPPIMHEQHRVPSAHQPQSAPPYQMPPQRIIAPSDPGHQRLASLQQPVQARISTSNRVSQQEPRAHNVAPSSDYHTTAVRSEETWSRQPPIESQASTVPQQWVDTRQHAAHYDHQPHQGYQATNLQTRQHPNVYNQPPSNQHRQPIASGTTIHDNVQYRRDLQHNSGSAPRPPIHHNTYPQPGPQLAINLTLGGLHGRPDHGGGYQYVSTQGSQQQQSSTQIDDYGSQGYPDITGYNNNFVPPDYALEPAFGEYQVPIDDGSQGFATIGSANDVGFGAFSDGGLGVDTFSSFSALSIDPDAM